MFIRVCIHSSVTYLPVSWAPAFKLNTDTPPNAEDPVCSGSYLTPDTKTHAIHATATPSLCSILNQTRLWPSPKVLGLGFGICLGFGMSQALSMVSLLEQLKGSQRKTFHNVRFMGDSTAVAIIGFYWRTVPFTSWLSWPWLLPGHSGRAERLYQWLTAWLALPT